MVPKRLKEARMNAGLSQEKLSELIGLEGLNMSSRLSSYEVGRTEPPYNLSVKIAKVLDYPEGYFYTLDDNFAEIILQIHRNRKDPSINPYYNSLVEAKKLSEQRDEAIQLVYQLNACLKK